MICLVFLMHCLLLWKSGAYIMYFRGELATVWPFLVEKPHLLLMAISELRDTPKGPRELGSHSALASLPISSVSPSTGTIIYLGGCVFSR